MNSTTLYIAIALGVIAIVLGIFFLSTNHPVRAYVSIAVGVILLVAGITALFVTRRRPAA